MAHGCPTICSRRGSGPEMIGDGVDGLLVDPADPARSPAPSRACCQTTNWPPVWVRRGRHRVVEEFSCDVLLGTNVAWYQGCLERFRQELNGAARAGACARARARRARRVQADGADLERPRRRRGTAGGAGPLPDPPEEVVVVDGSPHDATGRGGVGVGAPPALAVRPGLRARAARPHATAQRRHRHRARPVRVLPGRRCRPASPATSSAIQRAFESGRGTGRRRRGHREPDGPADLPPLARPPRGGPGAARRAGTYRSLPAPPRRAAC